MTIQAVVQQLGRPERKRRMDEQYEAKLQGVKLLGYNVTWTLGGIKVPASEFSKALITHGFKAFIPQPPAPAKALRRAIGDWLRHTPNALKEPAELAGNIVLTSEFDGKTRTLVRGIKEGQSAELMYGLVTEKVDMVTFGLAYDADMRVRVDVAGGTVQVCVRRKGEGDAVTLDELPSLTVALQPYWEAYRNVFLGYDLTPTLSEIVKSLAAVPTREYGGIFFVPGKYADQIRRLRDLVAELPPQPAAHFFSAVPIVDFEDAAYEMGKLVHDGLLGELAGAAKELEELVTSGREIRASTLQKRITEYQEMKLRAEMYAGLLDSQYNDVAAQLDDLAVKAFQALTGANVKPDENADQGVMTFE